jgi:hypothetical protein
MKFLVYHDGHLLARCKYAREAVAVAGLRNDSLIAFEGKVVFCEGKERFSAMSDPSNATEVLVARTILMTNGPTEHDQR